MSHLKTHILACSLLAMMTSSLAALPEAQAADENACLLHRPAPIERQLRRLSLVLRGHVPEYEEYAAVEGLDTIPDSIVDAYIKSDEYRLQMRRFHEALLQTNPANMSIRTGNMLLIESKTDTAGSATQVWRLAAAGRYKAFRGGNGAHVCQDLPQTDASLGYDAKGVPKCKNMGPDSSGNDYCVEGWVNVKPYWDPATTIKVCAYDAQVAETYKKTTDPLPGTYSCGTLAAQLEPTCGCGPNLAYCLKQPLENIVWADMREQLLRTVDDHSTGLYPYSGIVTTKTMHVNGRLKFWKKNLAPSVAYSRTYNSWHKGDAPLDPNPDWSDENWVTVEREAPHSGVLTLPAYTLRYQTNRGRANQFRIAFQNQFFVAPATPDREGCTDDATDVTKRCYCRDCHRILEPLAAHFGIVAESGSGLLTNFAEEVMTYDACNQQIAPGMTTFCNRFYAKLEKPDPKNPGKMISFYRLLPLEYKDDHPEIGENFNAGPAALAQQSIADGSLARATVAHLFSFLVRRELNLDPASEDNEITLLEELTKEFKSTDDFPQLVKRIVQLSEFRRMP